MNLKQELNLQLFADAGTLVNASGNYVNAYSGETNAFPEGGGMTASMKTFYDTELIRALAPHAKKLRFSTLANLSVKNPWRMSPDFSDFY